MRHVLLVLVLFGTTLFQMTFLAAIRPFGVSANLLLVFLVSWALVRGIEEAGLATAVGGIFLALFSSAPPWLALLAILPVIPLALVRDLHLLESNFLMAIPVLISATVLYFGIMLIGLALSGDGIPVMLALRRLALPTLVGNLMLLAPVYWSVSLVASPPRRASPVWGRSWGLRS